MAAGVVSLVLLLFAVSNSYIILDDDEPTSSLEWPSEYYFEGETIDMLTSLVQPFKIWYSAEHNRSRIDLYDGEIKKYYVGETEDEGSETIYEIHAITSKNMETRMICIEQSAEGQQEDFLIDTYSMKFLRKDKYNGKDVQVWQREMIAYDGDKIVETVTVHRTEQNVDIPYEYTQTTSNLKKGDISSMSITKFYQYKATVGLSDLEVSEADDCEYGGKIGENFKNDMKVLHPMLAGDVDKAFESYKLHHNKRYNEDEHEYRKRIFHQNWRFIEQHNRKFNYKLELNMFADRTEDELKYLTGTFPSDPKSVGTIPFPHTLEEVEQMMEEIPDELDLRVEGAIRPIKTQENCGSCWAFATTAVVEGAIARNLGGRAIDLSEQSLVDCGWGYGNAGCSGGMLDTGLMYVLDYGIPEDLDYGLYKATDAICHIQNMTKVHKIRGFGMVNPLSANSLRVALYKYGPVSVAIYAGWTMKLYSNGIYYDPNCKDKYINHGVTVVGYGNQNGVPYWIVRNSWGESWGEDGYILMSAVEDNCLILDSPYYAVV